VFVEHVAWLDHVVVNAHQDHVVDVHERSPLHRATGREPTTTDKKSPSIPDAGGSMVVGTQGPLRDVRVLDLTRFPPGAYCTVLLSDLGADVCRVDAPGANPAMAGVGVGLSRGKRSVALDLRHPRGTEVLRRLAGWADVLVENNRPGDMEQRGYGYPQAAEEHPRLIWCSITGFGQDGPYARRPGHDLTYVAHSGLLTAISPDLPWHPQTVLAVPLGAMMAATGIASALLDRERTGRGCQVDISLAEAATWLLSGSDGELADAPWGIPVSPDRRCYACSDGRFVTVAAAEPRTWSALCEGLELPELAADGILPRERSDEVTARLAAVFATRPAAEWVDKLGALGAAVGAVNRGSDVVHDPQVVARGSLVLVAGATVPGNPIRLRDLDGPRSATRTTPPPVVGGETLDVLRAAGYTGSEIDELQAAGVIG
jgi:alpha-methylacyl-CoA racemase